MYLVIKRIFDIILSLVLLILLAPIFLIIMIILKISHVKNIFYIQNRSGKNNKTFKIYKFTTIVNDKSNKFCYILRKTGLDELPQLINILKGEMSFIGPRPWIEDYSKYFNKKQMKRLNVLPGLTGYAQIHNCKDIFEKIKYDLEYVNNISFIMDIKVIFKTIIYVFSFKKKEYNKTDIKKEIEDLKKQNK